MMPKVGGETSARTESQKLPSDVGVLVVDGSADAQVRAWRKRQQDKIDRRNDDIASLQQQLVDIPRLSNRQRALLATLAVDHKLERAATIAMDKDVSDAKVGAFDSRYPGAADPLDYPVERRKRTPQEAQRISNQRSDSLKSFTERWPEAARIANDGSRS